MNNFTADALQQLWRGGPSHDRDTLVYGIARYVSKNGDLSFSNELLRLLNSFLTTDECVDLYTQIRDTSHRFEGDWRGQFIEYFPESAHALPPPIA